jgi:hypothetical protein
MKSYVIDKYVKSVDELPSKYTENAPEPKPDANQVLIDVYSGALNFFGKHPACADAHSSSDHVYASSAHPYTSTFLVCRFIGFRYRITVSRLLQISCKYKANTRTSLRSRGFLELR